MAVSSEKSAFHSAVYSNKPEPLSARVDLRHVQPAGVAPTKGAPFKARCEAERGIKTVCVSGEMRNTFNHFPANILTCPFPSKDIWQRFLICQKV
jgi:hypothetical protein